MTNQEQIVGRLERIEAELVAARQDREGVKELKEDLDPLVKSGFQLLLKELGQVEAGFQLEDVFVLIKRLLRNVGNLAFALDQMENVIELWRTMEPMLKSAVHQGIRYLGTLEQRGVFRTYQAMLEVRAKVAAQYGPEDIEAMGDSFVELLGLLKKMASPEMIALLGQMTELPSALDLASAKPVGPMGLIKAARDPEIKQGLGVALELTKALGKLKNVNPT